MKAEKMNYMLIKKFPELETAYHNEVDWQEGDETGSHVVYGDVFVPYIKRMIALDNKKKINEIFKFIEEMLRLEDGYATEVIILSVLEELESDNYDLNLYEKYFGSKTKEIIKFIRLK